MKLASDLGLTTARIGNALRPLIAGDQSARGSGRTARTTTSSCNCRSSARRSRPTWATCMSPARASMRTATRCSCRCEKSQTSSRPVVRNRFRPRTAVAVTIWGNAQGRPSGDVGRTRRKIVKEMSLPQRLSLRHRWRSTRHERTRWRGRRSARSGVVFIHPRSASQFGSSATDRDHGDHCRCHSDRRATRVIGDRYDAEYFLDHRLHHADGCVTKNAILLVRLHSSAIRNGMPVHEAIREAGQVRLRPILMTTARNDLACCRWRPASVRAARIWRRWVAP